MKSYTFRNWKIYFYFSEMNFGRKTPSMGTPSVYSHVTTRSSANLKSSRSMRSVRIPWYQKPVLQDAIVLDIQRGALVTGFFSLVSSYSAAGVSHCISLYLAIFLCHWAWNVLLHNVSVSESLHSLHGCVWYLLPCPGCTWLHPLWILHYQLWICICGKCPW